MQMGAHAVGVIMTVTHGAGAHGGGGVLDLLGGSMGPPGQLAVPDISPARGAQPARFARRIGGKVVVQHEVLAVLPFERVDDLLVLTGPERRYRERLGLASGEQCRAVSATKDPDLARNRPDSAGIATVNPCCAPQHGATDDLLFEPDLVHHPHGQAKWLESTLHGEREIVATLLAETVRKALRL